jgi:hypothetical protein
MGGRTRKLRNLARRTGLTQATRFDSGSSASQAAPEPVKTEVKAKKVTKKSKKKVTTQTEEL